MLELMTWNEIIENLRAEGNFKMAVLFDLKADKIAGTDGAMMDKEDAIGVMRSMDVFSTRIYGIFLAGSKFRCLTVDKDSVVGRAGDDIFVANRNDNVLICAVSRVKDDFSCLGAIKNFMGRLGVDGSIHGATPSLM